MTLRRWIRSVPALALFLATAPVASGAGGWNRVADEDGIVVDQKAIPGRDMPAFRGRTVIDAQPVEILAVLQDWRRHPDWRPRCIEAKLVQQVGPSRRFLYSRSDSPWPVSDRDVVIYTEFEVSDGGRKIESRFTARSHPKVPPVDGVVRMTHLTGHYRLESNGNGTSQVEYQVESDPGGNVPEWMVVRESRDVPLDTLRNLRSQVVKSRGRYDDFIRRWGS